MARRKQRRDEGLSWRLCHNGINNLPIIADYWSSDIFIGNDGIKQTMIKNRFEEISQFFHLNNSSEEPARGKENFDRLYRCRPALTSMLRNAQHCYSPKKNISIDEGMIAFKGRLSFRQYLPAKPTKYGIKVWMAADASNGYVKNFSVYLGSEGQNRRIHGLGYDAVMNMARASLNRNHHVFFDNFFQSHSFRTFIRSTNVRLFDCAMYAQRLAALHQEQTSPAGRNNRMPKRKPSFYKMARQKGCGIFFHECFTK